jgi:hypothetical protein
MTDFHAFVLTVISSAGTSLLLSGAGIWLARSWITERLRASIKYEYDQQLATINSELKLRVDIQLASAKADVDRQAEKLRIASTSFSEVQKAAIARKLDSVDTLWSGLLKIREITPPAMSFMDILTPAEFSTARNNQNFRRMASELDFQKVSEISIESRGTLERIRPYIGEYAWALFATYHIIVSRIMFLIHQGNEDTEKLNWHNDLSIRRLLSSGLGQEGLDQFDNVPIGRVTWIREQFEVKILTAMERLITGKEFSTAALSQAQLMEEQIRQANRLM